MKKGIFVFLAAVTAISLSACGNGKVIGGADKETTIKIVDPAVPGSSAEEVSSAALAESVPEAVEESEGTDASDGGGVTATGSTPSTGGSEQIANPWTDYENREEMEKDVGFDFNAPDSFSAEGTTYSISDFRAMADGSDKTAEIIYADPDQKDAEAFRVRKAEDGKEQDISGDYYNYMVSEKLRTDGGVQVSVFYNDQPESGASSSGTSGPVASESDTDSMPGIAKAIWSSEGCRRLHFP